MRWAAWAYVALVMLSGRVGAAEHRKVEVRIDALLAKFPKVVSIEPANGAAGVNPGLTKIVITFDRPMVDRSWSVLGSGPTYPVAGGVPSYDAARRVLTLPARLEVKRAYRFGLNGGRFTGFVSEEGYPLEPVLVMFTTKG